VSFNGLLIFLRWRGECIKETEVFCLFDRLAKEVIGREDI
jgi:hypothetical protein